MSNDISTPSTSPESPESLGSCEIQESYQTQTENNGKHKNLFIYQIDSPAKLYSALQSSSVIEFTRRGSDVSDVEAALDIGIDCEWQPGSKNKMSLALVQIAVRDKVYIIDGVIDGIDGVVRGSMVSQTNGSGDGYEAEDLERISAS